MSSASKADRASYGDADEVLVAVEAAGVGTWDYYPLSGELRWSRLTRELVGLSDDSEASYDLFLASINPNDRERVESEVAKALETGSGAYSVEYRAVDLQDKRNRWLSVRGRVFHDSHGRPVRFTGTAMDISAQKSTEAALRKMAGELRRSNEDLENFATILAHDLKEPLRMVTSFLKLISDGRLGEKECEECLHFAFKGAMQMKNLIDALQIYSSVARGGGVDFELVDCTEVLEKVLVSLQKQIEETGARITYDRLPKASANSALLGLVFQNLLDNAMKFKSGIPEIRVSARESEGKIEFSIRDNGIGFSEEDAERIFDLFQKLGGLKDLGGTGAGLAICRKIVERHGGRIWADSTPGKGSVFHFSLSASGAPPDS